MNSLQKTSEKIDTNIGFNLLPDKTVKVHSKINGISTSKIITINDLIEIIESSYVDAYDTGENETLKELDNTGILPHFEHIKTLKLVKFTENKYNLYLLRENKPVTMNFANDYFDSVKLPKLVFKISITNLVVTRADVYAIKDKIVSPETKLYRYPLSNVSRSGICFGSIKRPVYQSIQNAFSFPDFFLSTKMNMDYFKQNNKSDLDVRPFLEHLGKLDEFDNSFLVETKEIFSDL